MKKKLFAAAISLAIAAIMLTSASFAWFTIATEPMATSIDITMESTKNLEISKGLIENNKPKAPDATYEVKANDTGDERYWGSTITFNSGANVNFPAYYDATAKKLRTVAYDKTGRIYNIDGATKSEAKELQEVTAWTGGTEDTNYTVSALIPADVHVEKVDGSTSTISKNVAVAYVAWLRSNVDLDDVVYSLDTTGAKVEFADGTTPVEGNDAKDYYDFVVYKGSDDLSTWTVIDDTTKISLTKNVASPIAVVGYMKGDKITAKMVGVTSDTLGGSVKASGIKIKFSSTKLGADPVNPSAE